MAIQEQNIKLLASQIMNDVPEGGGAATGTQITDGASNQIFTDISELDRTYGRVNLRKLFVAVQTPDTDGYFGAHVIVSDPPDDARVTCCLFSTEAGFDHRSDAVSRVESYLVAGPKWGGYLYENHVAGQRALALIQRVDSILPTVGQTLTLTKNEGLSTQVQQYVRVTRVGYVQRVFTDSQGDFTRWVVTLDISDALRADMPGYAVSRYDAIANGPNSGYNGATVLRDTTVADAARYYGVAPLVGTAATGDLSLTVGSIYTQLVPSAQTEVPVTDARANASSLTLAPSAAGTIAVTTAASLSPATSVFVGGGIYPGTLAVTGAGVNLADSNGKLMDGATEVGAVDYANGLISIASGGPTYSGSKTFTFRPAAAPSVPRYTMAIPVTAESRSLTLAITLDPIPAPATLDLAYMAGGRWYVLREQGGGAVLPSGGSLGAGQLNFGTGGLTVTLGALPDVGSSLVLTWGDPGTTVPLSAGSASAYFEFDLAQSVAPGTLTLAWNDGSARSVTDNGTGGFTGDGTGLIDYSSGKVRLTPTTLPPIGTASTIGFQSGTAGTAGSISTLTDLGSTWGGSMGQAVVAKSFSAEVACTVFDGRDTISTRRLVQDDGSGTLRYKTVTQTGATVWDNAGTIDYSTGDFTLTKVVSVFSDGYHYRADFHTVGSLTNLVLNRWVQNADPNTLTVVNGSALINIEYLSATSATPLSAGPAFDTAKVDFPKPGGTSLGADSLRFALGGNEYIQRLARLDRDVDAAGAGTDSGTIDLPTAVATLTWWAAGQSPTATIRAGQARVGDMLLGQSVFRAPLSPVRPGSFSLAATRRSDGATITASADSSGNIVAAAVVGKIDYQSGVGKLWFRKASGAAEEQLDLSAEGIPGVTTVYADMVYADTLRFSLVGYTYLPLDADILGLDPVRLPSDGRAPIFRAGDVAVIHHKATTAPATVANGQTVDCGRTRLARVRVIGNNGATLTAGYTSDLDAGTVSFTDVTGYSQPVVIEHRIEDMALVSEAQIGGQLSFTRQLTHDFPAGSLVSSALIAGDMGARVPVLFDQQTWANAWADAVSGGAAAGTFNDILAPIAVTNEGAITERWVVRFTNTTSFEVQGEHVGVIATGNVTTDCAPLNPFTAAPYFTVPAIGWGAGWVAGNALRFNTVGAQFPVWAIRTIAQGPSTDPDDAFEILIRGDVDRP